MAFFGLFKNKKKDEPTIQGETQPVLSVKEIPVSDTDTEDISEITADYSDSETVEVCDACDDDTCTEDDDYDGIDEDDEDENDLWDPIDIDDSADPAEAAAMFQEAMELYKEADRHPNSDDAPALLADAYARMEQAAMAGHVKAMFYAGMMCRTLVGYDDDEEGGAAMASDWFHVAANRGHKEAQYLLGIFYEKYPGYDSGNEARTWITAAASQGHLDAIAALKKL